MQSKRQKTAPCSARRWILSALNQPDRAQSIILMMRWRHWKLLACQRSFAPLLRLAVKGAGWPIILRNLKISCAMVCACPLFRKSLSKNRFWAGKNMRWRWCAIMLIIASSSARLKMSIRWACIQAIPSPLPLPLP